jgi:hypothetical protein
MRKSRLVSLLVAFILSGFMIVPLSISVPTQQKTETVDLQPLFLTRVSSVFTLRRESISELSFIDLRTVNLTSLPSAGNYDYAIPTEPVIPVITPPPKNTPDLNWSGALHLHPKNGLYARE